ncbi:MAG: histidine--tRNA ligase [Ignavibacteriota bacterium]|jgi:histidyl-tRNA synthetase|nr:histidine--tRNA ligase [Ignavibacteriales bacterium]MBL1121842.1 histidine--tRNA ligase [Ignavibacteriota bacterium]MCC7093815.1 histidine--tRNA ligase [Ignavibacteriaceae bacterium]MEB2297603.1 histidine--tRNA ligase [Ignavibacteria bacterium]QKJ96856.1 MAG: histidine--tRNA ligase [Ignavibacteriota bacterium]
MIKAVTGTKDILPSDIPRWKYLEKTVERIFSNFNYKEIRTPVFEETSLFARGIGEETDIVGKEMYTFKDRSDTSLTLKPEMTASVVRSFVEHSLGAQQSLVKLFYISPMFRQERPQAGRFRQFHQFGAEAIGSKSPLLDAEMIQMAYEIFKSLGLKNLTVKINSLGTPETRENYKKILKNFLEDKKNNLSEDSRRRFETNILRIFDSKVESDQKIIKDAPKLIDHLDEESKNDFDVVKDQLKKSNIPFIIDSTLVRGLDYYTKLTFEIDSGSVGAQTALCGGGRYDLLIENIGGKPTPATGFAAGIERILLACENEKSFIVPIATIDVYLIRIDNDLEIVVSELAVKLRKENLSVDFDYLQRSVKAQMREANKLNAKYVLFIGGDEYKQGMINLKNMATGVEEKVAITEISKTITRIKTNPIS